MPNRILHVYLFKGNNKNTYIHTYIHTYIYIYIYILQTGVKQII